VSNTGLFWTTALRPDNVQIDLEEARASLVAHDLEVEDYHDLLNAIKDGPSKPATVSFEIEWEGLVRRVKVDRSNNGGFGSHDWGGQFAVTGSTAAWSGHTDDNGEKNFSFQSDPEGTSTSQFAIIGHERNGVFFRHGDEGGERD
jgi:hypothetical protein